MKIIGIAAAFPSRNVTNQHVLDLIEQHSKEGFNGNLPKTLKVIDQLLKKTGIESRCWLGEEEQPMSLLETAFAQALAQANLAKEEIDLLIYTGVGRGFIEPANSCFVAKALDLKCRNFDVLDACMGWVSSMDLINDKMKAGTVRHAVVVNLEFNVVEGSHIFPKNFTLQSSAELAYKFPSFTVGEAATVTILSNEDPENFQFSFVNRPDLSDLCTISLPGWQHYCHPSAMMMPTGGNYQFNSHGGELHETAAIEAVNVFNQHGVAVDLIDAVFTHTSSPKQWAHYGELVGLADKIYPIAHNRGNLVTASIPAGIAAAIQAGKVKKGDTCLGWKGSAGMVFSAMTFAL